MIETPEYGAMMRRMVRAYGRRVADADAEDLADLVALRADLEAAITTAVRAQAERTSWAAVARGLSVTREAAWKRYAPERAETAVTKRCVTRDSSDLAVTGSPVSGAS